MHGEVVAQEDGKEVERQLPEDQGREHGRDRRDGEQPRPSRRCAQRPGRCLRQQKRQRPAQDDDAEKEQCQPGTAAIQETLAGPAGRFVQPGQCLGHAVAVVEHADMFGTGGKHQPSGGSIGEVAVRHAFPGRSAGGHVDQAVGFIDQEGGLERTVDDQKVARAGGRHIPREQRNRDGRRDRRMRLSVADDDIGRHRMTEQDDASITVRQAVRIGHHLVESGQQGSSALVGIGHSAAQGRGIPRMAGKVEGHGHVAVAGKRDGEGLHHLLRAGEAVADDHDRCRPGRVRPVHRHRNGTDVGPTHVEPRRCRQDLPQGQRDCHQRRDC